MNSETNKLSQPTVAFGLALVAASAVNAALVVAKEKIPAVQNALQYATGHHWITHAAIVLLVFGVCAGIFSRRTMEASKLIKTIVAGVVLSGLVIVAFYLIAG